MEVHFSRIRWGRSAFARPQTLLIRLICLVIVAGLLTVNPLSTSSKPASAATAAFVQSATSTTGTGSTMSLAFTGANTAGNTIVAVAGWDMTPTSTPVCSDTAGNVYETVAVALDETNSQHLAVCYANNVAASASNTVTVTHTGAVNNRRLVITEYSGISDNYPIDVTATNLATAGAGTDGATSTSATTTSDGDLIFGVISNSSGTGSISTGTGFNQRAIIGSVDIIAEDKTQASAGSTAATFSLAGTITYTSIMVAFRTNGAPVGTKALDGDGVFLYGKSSNAAPVARAYNASTNTFSAPASLGGTQAKNMTVRTSPNKREAIAAWTDKQGSLQVACYDGDGWSIDFTVSSVGGTSTTKRFDVAYETKSGDAMVMYSTDSATTSLGWRTKPGTSACGGSSWSSANTINPAQSSGIVQWVKMAPDRRNLSDLITVGFADANQALDALVWSGSSWGQEPAAALETTLAVATAAQDVDNFDLAYGRSGDVMVAWGANNGTSTVNGAYWAQCTGGTSSCTWTSKAQIGTSTGDDVINVDLAANPLSDEMVFASTGKAANTLQIAYWNNTTWTMNADVDTTTQQPGAGTRNVACGWVTVGSTTRSIVVYSDSGSSNVTFYAGNGATFALQSSFTAGIFDPVRWMDIQQDPNNNDRLMLTLADGMAALWAKRLVMTSGPTFTWSNADGGSAVESSINQTTASDFSFAYWRRPMQMNGSLTQQRAIFENDDGNGNPNNNTAMAANNTALTSVMKGERVNARFQVSNSGNSFDGDMGLFYDRNDGQWSRVMSSAPIPLNVGSACGANANWTCGDVDTGMNNYQYEHGMAIDHNGRPWISYYYRVSTTTYALRVATYVGSGGNCGTSSAWSCTTVYSNGNSDASNGRRNNIAVDADNNVWVVFSTVNGTWVATNRPGGGCGTAGSAAWTCTNVSTAAAQGGDYQFGIAINPVTNKPAISFTTSVGNWAYVARYVGTGGDCASTAWTGCGGSGINDGWAAIAYGPDGSLWMSYEASSDQKLYVAHYLGPGGNGSCDDTNWDCVPVDTTTTVGYYNAIAVGADGTPWIAYKNGSSTLSVAHYIGSGGGSAAGCGTSSSTAWQCMAADNTSGAGQYLSIAIAPDGSPWIVSYLDTTFDLQLTRYVAAGGGGSSGGCGASTDSHFFCGAIETSGDTGNFPALAFAPDGTAWIAWGYDTTYDLRFARLNRGGEILMTPSTSANGATITSSHGDMTSATDSGNKADADCVSGSWTNGKAFQTDRGHVTLGSGQCTEISFSLDTSQATAGTTYRFMIASADSWNESKNMWRGPSAVSSGAFATITIEAATTTRISKDALQAYGSDCTTNTWTCTSIETTNNVGAQNSIAIAPDGTAWIAYNEVGTAALKVAKYVGDGNGGNTCAGGSNAWQCRTLESAANHTYGANSTALAIDANGNPWISYYDSYTGVLDLYVARYVGTGGTGCTSGATDWTCYQVATLGDSGASNSIAIDNTGRPWVAYYENNGTGKLVVAHFEGDNYVSQNNACTGSAGTKWTCTYITSANDQGRYNTIAIDAYNNPWIAYRNSTTGTVNVARYTGVNGSGCGTNVITWSCTAVDANGFQTGIAFDSANQAWLTYNNTSGNQMIAKYVGSSGTNCSGTATWSCGVADTGTQTTGGIAPGFAIDSKGNPWISYKDVAGVKRKVARYLGGAATGNCGSGNFANMFQCSDVTPAGATNGSNSSIAFDADGIPWVTSYAASTFDLILSKMKLPPNSPGYTVKAAPFNGRNAQNGDMRYTADFGKSPRSESGSCSSNTDMKGYCGMATNDSDYDSITAGKNEAPAYTFAMRSSSNTAYPAASLRALTSGATWNQAVKLEVYQNGTGWVALSASPYAAANTQFTLALAPTSGTISTYWEPDGANYWAYFRISQAASMVGATTLKINYFGTTISNSAPGTPASLTQFKLDGTTPLATGASTTETGATPAGTITDADGEPVNLCLEVKPSATAFDATGIMCSVGAFASGTQATLAVSGLAAGSYKWRAYSVDPGGLISSWVTFNGGSTAFTVVNDQTPNTPTTLDQKTTGDVSITTGGWNNSTSVKFTGNVSDPDNPDTLALCVEAVPVASSFTNTETGCGSTVGYSGSAVAASVTLTLSADTEYHWQARTKDAAGVYSGWLSFGGNSDVVTAARDVGIDVSAPVVGTVYDGSAIGSDAAYNSGSLSALDANWTTFNTNVSGLNHYSYTIGSTVGGTDIKTETSVATATSASATGLTLHTGQRYYFRVFAYDNAGNSSYADSDGQMVAPTLTFMVDQAQLNFALNPANSYTDSKSLNLTTSTNGYGGYSVRQSVTGNMSSGGNTIAMFNGGSYASPDAWQPGDTGFGYTSSDTVIAGSNKFQAATCPGLSTYAAPGCFAPPTTSSGGEVVADHAAGVAGAPVNNESFTLTYRLTVPATQPAGRYSTIVLLTAVATF